MLKKSTLFLQHEKKAFILAFFLFLYSFSFAQQKLTVTGNVFTENNIPLAGVSVMVKGSSGGVTTNENGAYTISVPSNARALVFSYVNYVTQEFTIPTSAVLNVSMIKEADRLSDVVVIGYGTTTKKDMTGSVGQVKIADMVKAPVATFDEALAGRVAGVSVSSGDGQPGTSNKIVIRGGNSLTQSTAPLYVVDGFPMENYNSSALSPDDIASISVLKDASATAIYGSRGANGVIVIETKKGKTGKAVVNYHGSIGFQQVNNKMDMMNPYEFVKYQLEVTPTSSQTFYLDSAGLTLDDYKNKKGIDWQNLLLRTAPMQIHNVSIRGGDNNTKYSISGSLYDQDGVVINSNYKRYTGRMSLDHKISDKFKTGFTVALAKTETSGSPIAQGTSGSMLGYVMYNAWAYRPVTGSTEDLVSSFIDIDPLNVGSFLRINPVTNAKEEYYRNNYNDVSVNSFISYEIIPDLTLRISGGINSRKGENQYFYNSKTSRGTPLGTSNSRGVYGGVRNPQSSSWLNENTLTYNKKLDENNKLNLVGGFTVQKNNSQNFGMEAQQVPNEELGIAALASGTPYTNISSQSLNTLVSFLGRVNYSYRSKYLATFTMRADGSSKFPFHNRWGYFPSGALAWNVKEENFLINKKVISNAKLRISYGSTGNNRVGDFSYLPNLNLNDSYGYSFGNADPTKGVIYGSMGNAFLKWESTRQFDLGVDIGLLEDRISLTAEIYRKVTSDLLLNASLPRTTGFTSALENIGKVMNKGLELTLNVVNVKKKDFSWESTFNIAFNQNKVLELVEGQQSLTSNVSWDNFYSSPLYIARVGHPAAMFYGYIWDGNYQYSDFDEISPGRYILKSTVSTSESSRPAVSTVQPGDIKYRDLNGDGVITSADQGIIGNPHPIHIGGFSNDFTYKGFSLNVFFQWSYGNDIYNANRLVFEGNSLFRPSMNQYKAYANRWTPENQNNDLFRTGGQGPLGYYSSRVIEDGSFIRLKTVALAYELPSRISKKLYMSSLSFNISAQNLYVWTKYKGMDPEVSIRSSTLTPGFDFSAYPRARTIVFGVNANF